MRNVDDEELGDGALPALEIERLQCEEVVPEPGDLQRIGRRLTERDQRAHRCKVLAGFFRVGGELDVKLLSHRHAQLQRINRVKTETFHKERCLGIDIIHREILQVEGVDDQLLDLCFKSLHAWRSP